jgi:hypothetical protein
MVGEFGNQILVDESVVQPQVAVDGVEWLAVGRH